MIVNPLARPPDSLAGGPAAPPPLQPHDRAQIRTCVSEAQRRYPGPVGEIIARELDAWDKLGYRFGGHGLIARLCAELSSPPAPEGG